MAQPSSPFRPFDELRTYSKLRTFSMLGQKQSSLREKRMVFGAHRQGRRRQWGGGGNGEDGIGAWDDVDNNCHLKCGKVCDRKSVAAFGV